MKNVFLALLLVFMNIAVFSQERINSVSNNQKISFEPQFERGLPPELKSEISFDDGNNNNILEANETAFLKIKIWNEGVGPAQGVKIIIQDNTGEGLDFIEEYTANFIFPNQIKTWEIPILAKHDIKTNKHNVEIKIEEHFGYDADHVQLYIQTLEYQSPQLIFSGLEVVDSGKDVMPVLEDGILQPGELVKVKMFIQNIGLNVAKKTEYKITSKDVNIYLANSDGFLGNFEIGEVKEFEFKISPNKRVNISEPLQVYLNMTDESGEAGINELQLPIEVNKRPKQAEVINVAASIDDLKNQVKKFDLHNKSFNTNYGELVDIFSIKQVKERRPNSIGVIIGIEDYQNLPPAPYAVNDAMIIEKYFKDLLGIDNIVFLTNKDVVGLKFDDIFNPDYGELQKAIVKDETELFVFYSGHGIPNKKGDDVYLFPYDGKIERVNLQGYSLSNLYTSLNELGARRVTLFVDACFSGSSKTSETKEFNNLVSMKGVKVVPRIPKPWESNPNFVVFNSSSLSETSLAFDKTQTGLFTYYLCAGLSGRADANTDNQISHGELKKYVIENVKQTSKKIFGIQTPEFHGDENHIILSY